MRAGSLGQVPGFTFVAGSEQMVPERGGAGTEPRVPSQLCPAVCPGKSLPSLPPFLLHVVGTVTSASTRPAWGVAPKCS